MNNGYGNLLPAMTPPSINLGYSPYGNPNGYGHLSNLLDMGMPMHNTMPGLPGTLASTSPTSSPLTNSLPPIIQQQQHSHHHQHSHHQAYSHHHQLQQHLQHQHHHQSHSHQPSPSAIQLQIHHQPNQSQQQTPQPSPQHTSNSLPNSNNSSNGSNGNQSLPSSDSIQSPPIYSELSESLLNSSTNGGNNPNLLALTTTTTTSSVINILGSPDDLSSPKIKSKKMKTNSGKAKGTKLILTPLESSLNSLTKEQLVNLCSHFFQEYHRDLIPELENLMPPPDLHEIMLDLDSLQKKYNKLFPSNEFTYDNTSYNRVKSGLATFKKSLIEYGEDFKEKASYGTLLQYVILALPYALRMPQWDDEKNNASRISALNKMDVFGKAAVKGLLSNELSLEKWEKHKLSLSPHTLYLKSTIDELDKCIDKRKKKDEKTEKTKKRKKIEK